MASNQVSNHRNRQSGNQKSQAATRQQSQEAEQSTMGQVAEYATDYMSQGADYVRDITRDREGSAVGVALAAGFGIGLVLGCSIARSYVQSEPRSLRDRIAEEGLGRRVMASIERMIPEAVAQHFGR